MHILVLLTLSSSIIYTHFVYTSTALFAIIAPLMRIAAAFHTLALVLNTCFTRVPHPLALNTRSTTCVPHPLALNIRFTRAPHPLALNIRSMYCPCSTPSRTKLSICYPRSTPSRTKLSIYYPRSTPTRTKLSICYPRSTPTRIKLSI